jgi:hypothetical protein
MMQTQKAVILGMKRFVGTVEGKSYDTTKIYVQAKLDDSTGNGIGYASQEFPAGSSEIFDKYKGTPLPAEFEIDLELVTTGKVMKQIVRGVRLVKK